MTVILDPNFIYDKTKLKKIEIGNTYLVSKDGDIFTYPCWRIRSDGLKRYFKLKKLKSRKRRPRKGSLEREYVDLENKGTLKKGKTFKVHRVVALAWLGIPPKGKNQINHIDGNPLNNHYTNLEWCNSSHNIKHAYQTELMKSGVLKDQHIPFEVVENIRKEYEKGKVTQASLARKYEISISAVHNYVKYKQRSY